MVMNLLVPQNAGISWEAKEPVASQGLISMELAGWLHEMLPLIFNYRITKF
jgi:hypothetical protein